MPVSFLLLLALLTSLPAAAAAPHPFGWDNIRASARPSTFWWWLGSSVSRPEIARQLRVLKQAGFGGVTVCPIYATERPALPPIPYLSDRWTDMFRFTLEEGKKLDMLVDMPMGGGWPMGGPWIEKQHAERDWRLEKLTVEVNREKPFLISDEAGGDPIACVTLVEDFDRDSPARVVPPRIQNGKRVWVLPPGRCNALVARMGYSGLKVYVGGPGGVGPVFDYWSPEAFRNLAQPIEKLLAATAPLRPRAVYCDSFEGQGGATPGIFEAFEKRNGYDLRPYLHGFLHETGTPENRRLWHDYRQTMAALHIAFVRRWSEWAHVHGMLTRYQYTGDPAHPIDTCGEADIPEDAAPYNTSAAHIFGQRLISRETFTWGAGHNFIGSLDWFRRKGDDELLGGINHMVFHGTPFTPQCEPWPGPMYYAGGNFSQTQPWFPHIRWMNDYFARVQETLQASEPDSDVLVLWPIHDFWQLENLGGFHCRQPFVWRNSNSAIARPGPAEQIRTLLARAGIQADFISDRAVAGRVRAERGVLKTPGATYRALVVPDAHWVEPETLRKLAQLDAAGVPVIFVGGVPAAVPHGLPLVQDTSRRSRGARLAANGKELMEILARMGLREEGLPGKLSMLRMQHHGRPLYLIKNSTVGPLDVWAPLARAGRSVTLGNPRSGQLSVAEQRPGNAGGIEVHLRLAPSEMILAKLGDAPLPPSPSVARASAGKTLGESWKLSWLDYAGHPHEMSVNALKSWTEYSELGLFSGLVRYETTFTMTAEDLKTGWVLDAGTLYESASVALNGVCLGGLWTEPFELECSRYLRAGRNTLSLEVANLAQNRILDMNRQGIRWRKSKLEDVGRPLRMDRFQPLPSGLLGPVRLHALAAAARN